MRSWPLIVILLYSGAAPGSQAMHWPPEIAAYLQAKGTIRMCAAPDWLPMEGIENGHHVGMAADFMTDMARRGGFDLHLVPAATWDEAYALALARECDILPLLMESPERLAYFHFTTPYLVIPGVLATPQHVPYIVGIEQVLDQPLGHMRGFAGIELLTSRHPRIRLIEVETYEEGLLRVQSGELFGMIGNMASIGYALQRLKVVNLKIAGRIGSDSAMSVATRNDEPLLRDAFQALVDSIDAGERQAVMNRWLAVRFEHRVDRSALWRLLLAVLAAAVVVAWWTRKLRVLNRQLDAANRRDPLTGLYNRMHFDEVAGSMLRRCARHRLPLAVAMIDLDYFKILNDSRGHPFGDACLRRVAAILSSTFRREGDASFRYGGEEFIVLSCGGECGELLARFELLRAAVEAAEVSQDGASARLTVSVGVWCGVPQPGDRPESLLKSADAALYEAKRTGRNRLVMAAGGTPAASPA